MPQWIVFLALAVVSWLVLTVAGGLVIGWLLRVISEHLPHPRRWIA